jgi:chromosome segregation ATPase
MTTEQNKELFPFDPFAQKRDPFFESIRSQRNQALTENNVLKTKTEFFSDEISRLTRLNRDLESTNQTLKNTVHKFQANGSNLLDLQNRGQYLKHSLDQSNRKNRELSAKHSRIQGILTNDLLKANSELDESDRIQVNLEKALSDAQEECEQAKKECEKLQIELARLVPSQIGVQDDQEDNQGAQDRLEMLNKLIIGGSKGNTFSFAQVCAMDSFAPQVCAMDSFAPQVCAMDSFAQVPIFAIDGKVDAMDIDFESNHELVRSDATVGLVDLDDSQLELHQTSQIEDVEVKIEDVEVKIEDVEEVEEITKKRERQEEHNSKSVTTKLCQLKSNHSVGCQNQLIETEFNKGQSICRDCATKRRKRRR